MKENIAIKLHRKLIMERRVQQLARLVSGAIGTDVGSILDVGAGTGELAKQVCETRDGLEFTGVDVFIRPKTFIPVEKYDGRTLPYEGNRFDAVMVVDVLHHCEDPVSMLRECARVTKKWLLIKDHICDSWYDEKVLRFMDWVGNRAHGVSLPYNYLSSLSWTTAFKETGLEIVEENDHLGLYPMPLDLVFGGSLHCFYLLQKDTPHTK